MIDNDHSGSALEDLENATHDHHALWSWLQQVEFGAEYNLLLLQSEVGHAGLVVPHEECPETGRG
jgi:hypothetical protein